MSTVTGYDYDYVFDLASRLSPEEQMRLRRELPSPPLPQLKERDKSFLPEPDETPYSADEFYEFLLRGPVIDEQHIRLMVDAGEEVNGLPLATLNHKHFDQIDGLILLYPEPNEP
jgi:hypothetical protein